MSVGGRAGARERILRRAGLALVLLAGSHWVLGIIVGAAAALATWLFVQARTVR